MPQKNSLEILEIKILARGGQGAKTAAQVVAEASLAEDFYFQAFPQFGPERRGAPVSTSVRLSKKPILIHSQIEHPDIAVIIEPSLLGAEKPTVEGKSTILIANTTKPKKPNNKLDTRPLHEFVAKKFYTLDASKIAQFFLGKNIPNLVMVGALISVIAKEFPDFKIDLESSINVVKERFSEKWGRTLTEKNIIAMRKGFEEVNPVRNSSGALFLTGKGESLI